MLDNTNIVMSYKQSSALALFHSIQNEVKFTSYIVESPEIKKFRII